MYLFEGLNHIIQEYLPPEQVELVKRAFVVARDAHEGQSRSSGEPYITHPVAVASIIAEMRLDHEAVMAALLHDVIEDTPYTEEQLKDEFGASVAEIVEGVSKLDKLKFRTRQEAEVANFRKMIYARRRRRRRGRRCGPGSSRWPSTRRRACPGRGRRPARGAGPAGTVGGW